MAHVRVRLSGTQSEANKWNQIFISLVQQKLKIYSIEFQISSPALLPLTSRELAGVQSGAVVRLRSARIGDHLFSEIPSWIVSGMCTNFARSQEQEIL